IAGFITQGGEPLMAFGNMGGSTQSQAHAQHVINLIDLGMNVQATTDVARFDHSQETDNAALDNYLYDLVGPDLEKMGHRVSRAFGHAGGYQGIFFERDPKLPQPTVPNVRRKQAHREEPINGVYRAGSDSRKDGHASGW